MNIYVYNVCVISIIPSFILALAMKVRDGSHFILQDRSEIERSLRSLRDVL